MERKRHTMRTRMDFIPNGTPTAYEYLHQTGIICLISQTTPPHPLYCAGTNMIEPPPPLKSLDTQRSTRANPPTNYLFNFARLYLTQLPNHSVNSHNPLSPHC